MLTRKLTILAATTALGLAAFGGTATADPKANPGCRGEFASGLAHEFGGLGHATTEAGFPISPADLQEGLIRPFCEATPEP
ncbi:MAG TPA: hypothetical protein VJT75_17935 [Thermoleophilaceae bacterium]|nr:hypothetical protein [Thermoleophilaceae bacterium]